MQREGRLIRLEVAPSHLDGFLDAMGANVQGSRQEKGNFAFGLARSPSEEQEGGPAIFYVWEEFTGADAFSHHHASPHFQAWQAWVRAQPEGAVVRRSALVTVPLLRD